MKRRSFCGLVGTVPVGLSGCISNIGSSKMQTPEAETSISKAGYNIQISNTKYVGTARSEYNSPKAEVDCEIDQINILAYMSTTSCRTPAIQSLQSHENGTLTIRMFPKWDLESSPGSKDCAGALYEYSMNITAEDELPGRIVMNYVFPDSKDKPSTTYELETDRC